MTARTDIKSVPAGYPIGEKRTFLRNVRWSTYEQLLADLTNQSAPRLAYDKGILEIMTPLPEHEKAKHVIEMIVEIFAAENNIDVCCLGSTTFKRQDLERGFEPDSCFYVNNALQMRAKDRIDLPKDPLPDLVIEIDITKDSLNKFPIYAQMGIAEVWCYDGDKLAIYKRRQDDYEASHNSVVFPKINSANMSELIKQGRTLTTPAFLDAIRKWAATIEL